MSAQDWVIIANSPGMNVNHVQKYVGNKKVLVLDGAADYIRHTSIHPDVILGDFDSVTDKGYWGITGTFHDIDDNSQPYEGHFDVLIVPAKDQDLTDLEKGILYCDAKEARSITIVNATAGGRMDHTLGNIGLLRKYDNPTRPLCILTETGCLEYIKDRTGKIEGKIGSDCAIMGYPEALMTTTGLKYNGQDYPLKLGLQESVCNTLASPVAVVSIKGEALLIKPIH